MAQMSEQAAYARVRGLCRAGSVWYTEWTYRGVEARTHDLPHYRKHYRRFEGLVEGKRGWRVAYRGARKWAKPQGADFFGPVRTMRVEQWEKWLRRAHQAHWAGRLT